MEISAETRRDIIDYLLLRERDFHGKLDLISFLPWLWNLSSLPSTASRFSNEAGDIWQHIVNNNDWDNNYLLDRYLDLPDSDDHTFLKFLETCLHPLVGLDEQESSEMVSIFNDFLRQDGYRFEVRTHVSGRPIFKAIKFADGENNQSDENFYEIVLSFAGEDRLYVEAVARFLKERNVNIFYDKYEQVTLWGKDLSEHLDKVYRGNARYCVMFLSKNYAEKVWTNHERRSAIAKALEEKTEYILPARFDSTEIPGIRPTIGYVDLLGIQPEELGKMIIQKLGRLS